MSDETVQVLPLAGGEPFDVLDGPGEARVAVGPHIGACARTMALVVLEPGSATRALRHPSEAVWYVVEGHGRVVPADGEALVLEPGAVVHVERGAGYLLCAAAEEALRVVGGPSPPDLALHGVTDDVAIARGSRVRLFHRDRPSGRVPLISSDARLIVWPGVGAETANMNYVVLAAGEENVAHSHEHSEDTIVVLEGRGSVDDLTHDITLQFEAGDVIHVPIGLRHRVKADRGAGVVSVGGPCPPDRAILALAEPA